MTTRTIALTDHLHKLGLTLDGDGLRQLVELLAQELIEVEAAQHIGADKYARTADRTTQRNGYRERSLETRVGELNLRIPKVRQGTFFPTLLEPRRRTEQALLAVVQEAYVNGVSTRKVDDLVQALGLSGIDKSTVSRICQKLDPHVEAFRQRELTGAYPYLWLDALYLKVRQNHRIVSKAVVIAIGVRETGEREVLGFAVGASEEHAFWKAFLRSLVARGLRGVQLVVSDAHEGLKTALHQVLADATWQRCRVHFMRNLLARIPQADKSVVAALVRTVFAQPTQAAARQQLAEIARGMQPRWPEAADLLRAAEDDVLAYMTFPAEHWTRLYSTNVLERLNREVKRRTDVVQVFPTDSSVVRLVGAVLMEIADEWDVERRYFSLASMHRLSTPVVAVADTGPRLAPVR